MDRLLPLANDPNFDRPRRLGTRARGMAYESRVGRWLEAHSDYLGWAFWDHPWLTSAPSAGPDTSRVCQPDFLLISPSNCILLVEAKLTQCDCTTQFAKYKNALKDFQVTSLQVCRRVHTSPTVDCLENTIDNGTMLLFI